MERLEDKSDIIVIDNIPSYNIIDYDTDDDKDFIKFINDVEKDVRTSLEYREFVNYLRDYMDMNKCSFLENVSNKDSFKIKIHIHHHPLTLYEIAFIIFRKRQYYGESLELEEVSKEVMYVHYFLMVGLIPLSETVHELVHDQLIYIPLDKVMGDWQEFMDVYDKFIPEETREKIDRYQKEECSLLEEKNRDLLKMQPMYIQMEDDDKMLSDGSYNLSTMNNIMTSMNNRLLEIKQQHQKQIEEKEKIIDQSDNITNRFFDENNDKKYIPLYFDD